MEVTQPLRNELYEGIKPLIYEDVAPNTKVDGVNVLGILKGPFFVPEGTSRNKRFYAKSLWEKQLARPEIQAKVSEKRMFGTVGHDQPIDDKALLDGKITHIVTDLQMEKDGVQGYGEAAIVGTPSGQILNTMLRAGAKLYTSSRAVGKFKGVTESGVPIVDPDAYDLNTFDVVIDPGFLQANPKLHESYNELLESLKMKTDMNGSTVLETITKPKGDTTMDAETKALLAKAMDEAANLRASLSTSLREVEALKNEKADLADQVSQLKESASLSEGYKPLGKSEEIKEKLASLVKAEETLKKYEAAGSPEECIKALTEAAKTITNYQAIGKVSEIEQALAESKRLLLEYKKLGSPKEIDRVLEKFKKIATNHKTLEDGKQIAALAKEIGVKVGQVEKLWNTMKPTEIKTFFKDLVEVKENENRFTRKETKERVNSDGGGDSTGKTWKDRKGADSATRLMESMGGFAKFNVEGKND